MDAKQLKRKRIARAKFGEQCKEELKKFIEGLPTQELKVDPRKDDIEILVYHEDEDQVRSHQIKAIGLDTDNTLMFTDEFGDAFDQTELAYTAEVYPYILEIALGQY